MKILLSAAFTLAAAFSGYASAADTILSADKRFTIYHGAQAQFTPALYHPAGKTVFYSNLGKKYPKGVYYPAFGYTVSGAASIVGQAAWDAIAFTPASSGTITEIATGVGLGDGTNAVNLVLYNDANGLPGTPIKTWKFKDLPKLGTCCMLLVGKDAAGIPVTAGTQYWVGPQPANPKGTTFASWATNTTDEVDPQLVADFYQGVWSAEGSGNVPAIGIFGN